MSKLSSASIRLVQKLNRKNKNGEYPVYIVVCWRGRIEKSCGVSCLQKDWDSKREVIKPQCSNAPMLNKMLSDIKQRVIDRKNNYELNGRVYTSSMLLEECTIDFNGKSNVYSDVMYKLLDDRRLKKKTRNKYIYAYNKLCEYMHRSDFLVDEVTQGLVKDFIKALEISDGTIRDICSTIASVWNYAISRKLVDAADYPFSSFKFVSKFKSGTRDYFLDESHMKKLLEYWLDLCTIRNGKRWTYRDNAFENLGKRSSAEFSILWFLLMYKLNGSAPVEIAMLKCSDCKQIEINNQQYWAIDFRRQKTNAEVHVRLKRDIFSIIAIEHFIGRSTNGMLYPIVTKLGDVEKMHRASWKASETAIRHIRNAFKAINAATIQHNVDNHCNEPLVKYEKVVMYTARHSAANHLLNSPNVSVRELASILARSPSSISVYIHQLKRNEDIARVTDNLPI